MTITLKRKHLVIVVSILAILVIARTSFPYASKLYSELNVGSPTVEKDKTTMTLEEPATTVPVPASGDEINTVKTIAEEQGVEQAYTAIKNSYKNSIAAHDLAHLIGTLAYEDKGASGVSICDTDFGFGCFHGLFDKLIQKEGSGAINVAQTECGKLGASGQVASCIHGIGHGVFSLKGAIKPAINECQKVFEQNRLYCYDGAYMEYYT